jgi:hypothetical protein
MIVQGTTYQKIENYNSPGNDLSSMPKQNSSVNDCINECNSKNDCSGFVFEKSANNCWLKNKNVYDVTKRVPNQNIDLYLNNPLVNKHSSCPNAVNSVDSIEWDSYMKTNVQMTPQTVCGLAKAIQSDIQNNNVANQQLSSTTGQLINQVNDLGSFNSQIKDQMQAYNDTLQQNINDYNNIQEKIKENFTNAKNNTINEILSDTDLIVLHENYKYILWSTLAIVTIIIAINVNR